MTHDPVLAAVTHWEVVAGFAISALFPLFIRRWWPWEKSEWGWNTVTLELSIAFCLLPGFLYYVLNIDDDFLRWTQAVALGLVIGNVIWRTVLIRNTQSEEAEIARRDRDANRDRAAADESASAE
jgi:hypothetical protein